MKTIRVFAVEIELYDNGRWHIWATPHVVARNLPEAVKKVERRYKQDYGLPVRTRSAQFVTEAA